MNVTAFGNGDRLDVGLTLDPVAITEPDTLLDCMSAAFVSLVGPHRATAHLQGVGHLVLTVVVARPPTCAAATARREQVPQRGRIATLIEDATAVLQSVVNEIVRGRRRAGRRRDR